MTKEQAYREFYYLGLLLSLMASDWIRPLEDVTIGGTTTDDN